MDTQENSNMEMTPMQEESTNNAFDTDMAEQTQSTGNNPETGTTESNEIEASEADLKPKITAKRGRPKKVVEAPVDKPEEISEKKSAKAKKVTKKEQADLPEKKTTRGKAKTKEPVSEMTEAEQSVQQKEPAPQSVAVENPEILHEQSKPEIIEKEEKTPEKRGRKKKEEPGTDSPEVSHEIIEIPPLVTREELVAFDLKQLIEKTEEVLENEDFAGVKAAMILIRNRYDEIEHEIENQVLVIETEPKSEDVPEVSEETSGEKNVFNEQKELFSKLLNKYSRIRKQHIEKLEAEKLRNYDLKKQILEELKQLIESEETLQKSWEDFKRLQQQWKEIGHVPPAQSQDLWNSFNHLVDLFLDKVKINRELRDLDYKKNLETKLEICEKIEELLLDESIDNAFRRLGELQTLWRETGPVPSDKREEINARFSASIEKLKEKRKEYYFQFKEELEHNLEVKTALVVKIREINEQEISSAKVWGTNSDAVDELMKLWKNTGPVPKKHNEEIWKEFRQEMNKFFAEKKAFFGKLKDELLENYNRKQLLCKQAESLQESTDWKKTTQELIELQNEWKTIGPVPHRYSDNIWKQFRNACDIFFNRKKEYFSNIDKLEEENLKAKQELIEQMLTYKFGEDNRANLDSIKDFQRRFFDIGRVPIKEKNAIQLSFQKAVDSLLEKLKIGKDEKRRFEMKPRFENQGSPRTGHGDVQKESFAISSKISKLESDIQLWENNIEFFAKSKNAEILIRDFRDKIEKAKAELLILKEKQKLMKGMMN